MYLLTGKLNQADVPAGHSSQVLKSPKTALAIPDDRGNLDKNVIAEMLRPCPKAGYFF